MSTLTNRVELERQVLAAVIVFLKERSAATGKDHWQLMGQELQAAFPGIPQSVQIEACLAIDDEQTEAWWDGLAKTIEGEIVKNVLATARPRSPSDEA